MQKYLSSCHIYLSIQIYLLSLSIHLFGCLCSNIRYFVVYVQISDILLTMFKYQIFCCLCSNIRYLVVYIPMSEIWLPIHMSDIRLLIFIHQIFRYLVAYIHISDIWLPIHMSDIWLSIFIYQIFGCLFIVRIAKQESEIKTRTFR